MEVHLVDGTYELFRHFFALPSSLDKSGREVGGMRGVLASVIGMLEAGTTHLGVATDHQIESFRNAMFAGYKTGEGIDPALRLQFVPLEEALEALGVRVWPMTEQEADDALAAAARKASEDRRVDRVLICTPDKDLAQCVTGDRIAQLDRKTGVVRDEEGVRERFGVGPKSIPDYLALVGDPADGIPGLPGWGTKSAATVLARYLHLEHIPENPEQWDVTVRGRPRLAETLYQRREEALLFRNLATLRTDAPVFEDVGELLWKGPEPEFEALCYSMRASGLWERAKKLDRSGEGS